MSGWDDDEFQRSDEPAMEGAGRHLRRASYEDDPKPPREPLILPDPTPEERSKIDAILAAGRRHVSDGWEWLQSFTRHREEVRSAFHEGCKIGSHGTMPRDDRDQAWRYSDARKRLNKSPGADVIGWNVVCSDPLAVAHQVWRIAAVHKDRVWLEWGGCDCVVPASSVRNVTGERIA